MAVSEEYPQVEAARGLPAQARAPAHSWGDVPAPFDSSWIHSSFTALQYRRCSPITAAMCACFYPA